MRLSETRLVNERMALAAPEMDALYRSQRKDLKTWE
jgi:hypothetical protein